MSGLRSWEILDHSVGLDKPKPYEPPVISAERTFQLPTAKDITLAEYDPSSQGAITAHKLADYRRRRFSLVLLPNVHIVMDTMMEKVGDGEVVVLSP